MKDLIIQALKEDMVKEIKSAKVSEGMEVVPIGSVQRRSPSPEMIEVTPALPVNTRAQDTHVHTLIHHTTITNIVPSPALLPPPQHPQHHHPHSQQTPQQIQHHTPFRHPFLASPSFPHHHPHLGLSPTLHTPYFSLPAQFALGQLMNQSLYQSLPFPAPHPHGTPPHTSHQPRVPNHPSVAALRGAPIRAGAFNQALQQAHTPHPLLGLPLSTVRPGGLPQQRHLMAMVAQQQYQLSQQNPHF